jgi:hypothetical protein
LAVGADLHLIAEAHARVGIIALVDEATGYQRDRTKDALSRILEAFIAKELQPYLRTFPAEFKMFRLRGMEYAKDDVQRPSRSRFAALCSARTGLPARALAEQRW